MVASKRHVPAGFGYCRASTSHSRPRESKLMCSGCVMSGSLSTRSMASPSASCNYFAASAGESAGASVSCGRLSAED